MLRRDNLIDTEPREAPPRARPVPPRRRTRTSGSARSFDGTVNDLSAPKMGAVGATFGRNLPPDYRPDLSTSPTRSRSADELLAPRHVPARRRR